MKHVAFAEGVQGLLEPIDAVRQHPDNPNNGDIDAIVESVQVNGFYTAITADRNTGYILAGNHRYQALLALGATQIPVIWVDKDAADATRVLVVDNRTGALAKMDNEALLSLLHDLQETEVGLAGTGFDDDGMDRLLAQIALEQEAPIGDGAGFGAGDPAPNGIYQVVIDFYEEDARDELFAELVERPDLDGKVRTANI